MGAPARLALVTGGTAGIGKEIARGLALAGCAVILAGRDRKKGAASVEELRAATGNHAVSFLAADLRLVREAERLAALLTGRDTALHYLVHSAGLIARRRMLTAEGIETSFAVNYLTRFALTRALLPLLEAGGSTGRSARILLVGGAAQNGRIFHDDVNLTRRFGTVRAVLQYQAANDLFTVELARRLRAAGSGALVTIACLKPGLVRTGIRTQAPLWMRLLTALADPLIGQSAAQATEPAVRLLLDEAHEGTSGALFLNVTRMKPLPAAGQAFDPAQGRRLWQLSENLVAQAAGRQEISA